MGTYSLTVDIDSNQYPILKNSGYNLCIAKKVNGKYNVVWSGTTFLQNNFFQWVEDYQLFGQSTFTPGALVRAQTLDQDIQFGQSCVMEADGVLDPATGPIDGSTFHFINHYGIIHVGVNGSIGGKFLPIYVSPDIVAGDADLSPVVSVMAWFDLELETSVMFVKAISSLIEVNYLGTTTDHTVSYGGATVGVWKLDAANGTSIVTPRLGYSSATGFIYQDSLIDPYTFAVAARSHKSTQTVGAVGPRWVLECRISFTTSAVADASWAYLKQKIIPNLNQLVLPKTDELTIKVKLRWDVATFMTEMMKGATDEEKIKNAFNSELDALAIPPVNRQFTGGDVADIVSEAFVLLALGTQIALDRDTYSKTSVIGYDVVKGAPNQKWKAESAGDGLYYITGAQLPETYLSINGAPENGRLVIHSGEKMKWAAKYDSGGIRICVPGTQYSIELGHQVHKVYLWEKSLDRKQIWKVLSELPAKK